MRTLLYLFPGNSRLFVVVHKLVLVVEEELEGLLCDSPVRHIADDAHPGGQQELGDPGLVRVVGVQGNFPGRVEFK